MFEAERGELLWVSLVKLNNIRANYEFQEGVLTLFISLLKSPYVSDAYRGRNGFSGGGRGTFFNIRCLDQKVELVESLA